MSKLSAVKILDDTITTATGDVHYPIGAYIGFQATGETSAAAGAATIVIEGHMISDPSETKVWETIDTLALTLGTTTTSDSGNTQTPFLAVRARVSAISGTDATVRVYLCVER